MLREGSAAAVFEETGAAFFALHSDAAMHEAASSTLITAWRKRSTLANCVTAKVSMLVMHSDIHFPRPLPSQKVGEAIEW